MNILLFIGFLAAGIVIEVYTYPIVRIFGHMGWAERYLGGGGTYVAWKIIGILSILVGLYVLRGGL